MAIQEVALAKCDPCGKSLYDPTGIQKTCWSCTYVRRLDEDKKNLTTS